AQSSSTEDADRTGAFSGPVSPGKVDSRHSAAAIASLASSFLTTMAYAPTRSLKPESSSSATLIWYWRSMAATISTPIIESMPRSLNEASSGISSFSAISATSDRSCSFRVSFDMASLLIESQVAWALARSRDPSLDFVEEVADRLNARQALVWNLDAQPALQRADDLEDPQRVDGELADRHRFDHVVIVLLDHLAGGLAKHCSKPSRVGFTSPVSSVCIGACIES